MVTLPGFGAEAPPAVRRPVLEASFGEEGADRWARAISVVTVQAAVAPEVGAVEIVAAAGAPAGGLAPGDTGSISLGYEDGGGPVLVFTGEVAAIRRTVHGSVVVRASGAAEALARTRVNQSYEQQSAGDIVSDLAARAGVATGSIEDGATFPFYAVDDAAGAYEHVAALGRRCGFIATVGADDAVAFGPAAAGDPVRTFTYGDDIVALRAWESEPTAGAVTVIGEGAAGTDGSGAWSWVARTPPAASAGAGRARTIADPSLRSVDAAQRAAQAAADAAWTVRGQVTAPGSPEVVPGARIAISATPDGVLDGACTVTSVTHRFSKLEGFVTTARFVRSGAGAGFGALP